MKRIIIAALVALVSASAAFAQTSKAEMKEIIKERKAALKYTAKQLDTKVLKDAKQQAKQMKKQGWMPAAGTLALEKQLTDVYTKQYAMDGSFPRYIIGRSTAKGSSQGIARKHAVARARVDVANQMSQEVAALTEMTESNIELSAGEMETVAKMVESSKLLTQQSLGKTDVVLEAYREVEGGTEVQIIVCYEGKLAVQALLESFGDDEAEIKQKLESLLKK